MEFLPELAKQGLGYLIAVLESFVIVYLYKKLEKSYDTRISDLIIMKDLAHKQQQEAKDVIRDNTDATKDLVTSTTDIASNMRIIIADRSRTGK